MTKLKFVISRINYKYNEYSGAYEDPEIIEMIDQHQEKFIKKRMEDSCTFVRHYDVIIFNCTNNIKIVLPRRCSSVYINKSYMNNVNLNKLIILHPK
jgi:hypothetical protein